MSVIDAFDARDLASFGKLNSALNTGEAKSGDDAIGIGGDQSCAVQIAVHDASSNDVELLVQENACNTTVVDLSQVRKESKFVSAVSVTIQQHTTVSETISKVIQCRNKGLAIAVGCKDPETGDTFLADFAVGVAAGQIRFGGLQNENGVEKYNRLLIIANSEHAPAFIGSEFRR